MLLLELERQGDVVRHDARAVVPVVALAARRAAQVLRDERVNRRGTAGPYARAPSACGVEYRCVHRRERRRAVGVAQRAQLAPHVAARRAPRRREHERAARARLPRAPRATASVTLYQPTRSKTCSTTRPRKILPRASGATASSSSTPAAVLPPPDARDASAAIVQRKRSSSCASSAAEADGSSPRRPRRLRARARRGRRRLRGTRAVSVVARCGSTSRQPSSHGYSSPARVEAAYSFVAVMEASASVGASEAAASYAAAARDARARRTPRARPPRTPRPRAPRARAARTPPPGAGAAASPTIKAIARPSRLAASSHPSGVRMNVNCLLFALGSPRAQRRRGAR